MKMFLAIPGWVETLAGAIEMVINPVLILAATAGIIYSVIVGFRFVKADDKNARDEAKQKLITVIVGVVVTLALMGLFYWLAYAMRHDLINFRQWFY